MVKEGLAGGCSKDVQSERHPPNDEYVAGVRWDGGRGGE